MKRILCVGLVAIVMLLVPGIYTADAQDGVELRLNLSEGMTYTQVETTNITTDQDILGEQVHSSVMTRYEYSNEVLGIDRFGAADVVITYKSIYYKQIGPNGVVEYDSEHPGEEIPDLAQGYAALIGGQFTVRYSPQGEILAVEGIDELIDQIIAQYEFEDDAMRESFKDSVKAICNEESIKESIELPTGIYPKGAVQVGAGWKRGKQINTGFPIKMESEWKLEKLSDDIAYIDLQTKVVPNENAEPLVIESMTITYKLFGTMTGKIEVSKSTGLASKADLKLTLSGDIEINGIPGVTETITSHIVVNGRSHTEITDLALPANK